MLEAFLIITLLFALLVWQHFSKGRIRRKENKFTWKPDADGVVVSDQSSRETGGIRTLKKPRNNRTS